MSLLRDHDFRHLWSADLVSQLGTRISFLALPLLAVDTLHASTIEVSLLRTFQTIAYLVIGLQAGAWCDRMRARPVLVLADLGRAAALGSLPLAAAFGVLTIVQLYLAVLIAGVLTVFFNVSHTSYLPRLIPRDRLVEGNAKLAGNMSSAAVAAPTVAGFLVQWFGPPAAVLADAASFLWSAAWLRTIRAEEPRPVRTGERNLRREIGDGLRFVFGNRVLRAVGMHGASLALFQSANLSLGVVFLVREVHLSAGVIGVLGTAGLIGAIVASTLTRRVAGRIGHARLMLCAGVVVGAAMLLYPLTRPGWWLAANVTSTFVSSACIIVLGVVSTSFQQTLCPDELRGRVSATNSFLIWGAMPLGSVLAGLAGSTLGLRTALTIAGIGATLSAAWLLASPLRTLRDLPETAASQPETPR